MNNAMQEIERKFLVDLRKWKPTDEGKKIEQGYLSVEQGRVVRVRIAGQNAFLTIKGKTHGISRIELEYEIPVEDAKVLLQMCLDVPIQKTRFIEMVNGHKWEIDIFEGANQGLVMAEIELKSEDQKFDLPEWVLNEVSYDHRFFNSWLSKNPYSTWKADAK
jgi:adenylate cyclase